MPILIPALLAVVIAASADAPARAQAAPSAAEAWVAEPEAGASSAEAYLLVDNPTMYDLYVVGVTCDATGTAEIVEGPANAARAVPEVPVPAYGRTEMKPGSLRIRLTGLKRPLKAGDAVSLSLITDGGAVITVTAPVKATSPS